MKRRTKYHWGASAYLADFEKGEIREYDEEAHGFPWRSLAAIASRLGKAYGVRFKFHVDKATKQKYITRYL